jgi:hypothetical protein
MGMMAKYTEFPSAFSAISHPSVILIPTEYPLLATETTAGNSAA